MWDELNVFPTIVGGASADLFPQPVQYPYVSCFKTPGTMMPRVLLLRLNFYLELNGQVNDQLVCEYCRSPQNL